MSTAVISDFPRSAGFRSVSVVPQAYPAGRAGTSAPSGRLRLTKRGRAVLTAVVAVPVAAGVAAFVLSGASAVATPAATSTSFDYVQVESGQSLWQLAATVAPDADPRDVVADIVHLNRLTSTDVQPGQRLAVPLQYAD